MEIQIISGFSGSGKTTFLNKYLAVLPGSTAVIENESGEAKLDKQLLEHRRIPVYELCAGCLCCSLPDEFRKVIKEIKDRHHPDRILIEVSGVGRLSNVIRACCRAEKTDGTGLTVTKLITIVDIASFMEYAEDFGSFYLDQIQNAGLIFLSHLEELQTHEKRKAVDALKALNPSASLFEEDFRTQAPEYLAEIVRKSKDCKEPDFQTRENGQRNKPVLKMQFRHKTKENRHE